jgi:hypothetical protein
MRADRFALFAAVLVLLAGYLSIYRPAEAAIADRYAQLDDARRALDQSAALARRAVLLRREQRDLRARLLASGIADDRTALVARFVRAVALTTRADAVHVTSLAASADAPAPSAAIEPLALTVSLRGTYAHLLALVHDLDQRHLALAIGVDALGNADPRVRSAPALQATLRITLLHLTHPLAGFDARP